MENRSINFSLNCGITSLSRIKKFTLFFIKKRADFDPIFQNRYIGIPMKNRG